MDTTPQPQSSPRVVYDFEFLFTNGQRESIAVEEGRDVVEVGDAVIRFELHPEPSLSEEILVTASSVAFRRTVRREVAPESTTDDAGRTQVTT